MEWKQTRIPIPLFKEIKDVMDKHPSKGYTNEHEFIRAAVREKIDDITNKTNKKGAS